MTDRKPLASAGADWTHLLSDPDLVRHLGKLLQTYREAPPEKREQALLAAMMEIKGQTAETGAGASLGETSAHSVPTAPAATPPFEPDLFTPNWGQDRRRYPRIKCFVAVELRPAENDGPIWGNLLNTSLGGCFVETVSPVKSGTPVEIGLWVANGKIWIKGFVLTGVVTQSKPSFSLRVRFSDMEPAARENLRQFLKFIEGTTREQHSERNYLQMLK